MENSPPNRNPLKRGPAVRTMKSDVAEYVKTAKPSLLAILARQAQWEGAQLPERRAGRGAKVIMGVLGIGIILLAGAAGYLWYGRRSIPSTPRLAALAPGFIFFEATEEVTIRPTGQELLGALREKAGTPKPAGSLQRLAIRVRTEGGSVENLELNEFFSLLGVTPPAALSEGVSSPPQLFLYRQEGGARFGLMVKARNPARLLQGLWAWESSLADDLAPLLFGETAGVRLGRFQDLTYQNVDFRLLRSSERDIGIGYLLFPARNLIVIATSEETLRLVITRLFESRSP